MVSINFYKVRVRADKAYRENDMQFFFNLSDSELCFLWGLCCTVDGAVFDDEVYAAIDARGGFEVD